MDTRLVRIPKDEHFLRERIKRRYGTFVAYREYVGFSRETINKFCSLEWKGMPWYKIELMLKALGLEMALVLEGVEI